jgi:hypothetical protein
MKLLHITDIHGRTNYPGKVPRMAKDADYMIISGDITHFGHYSEADGIITGLSEHKRDILAVTGNCDNAGVRDLLADKGFDLEGKGVEVGDIGFFGLGGSNATPFNTPNEKGEDEIKETLETGYRLIRDMPVIILVSHPPPWGTDCDITGSGVHAGSRAVREFIQSNRVDYCLCGHIHEARAMNRIDSTWIINPGPLHMGFAMIDIEKEEATLF